MEALAQRLKAVHSFVPVYTPWINGTVERVNRDILQILRVMLLELKCNSRNWVFLLPVIQASLNHTPVASLGGCAPLELFTGLPATSELDTVVDTRGRTPTVIPIGLESIKPALDFLRASLAKMHATVVDKTER